MIQTITSGQNNQSFIEQFDMSLCSGPSYNTITGDLVLPWGGDGVRGGYDALYLKNSEATSGTAKLTFTLPQNTDANSQVRFEMTTANGQYGSGNYTFNAPDGTTDTHTFSASEHYTWFCNASAGDVIMLTSTDGTSADIVSIIVTYIGSTSDTTKYVNDIILNRMVYNRLYEILDYVTTPNNASVNTGVLVDGSTIVEMIVKLTSTPYNSGRFFSSNDTDTDDPGWGEPGTWGLQWEDTDHKLSVKLLGDIREVRRTPMTANSFVNRKLRYHLTATGYLNIYNSDDSLYYSWDGSSYTDPTATSSTPIKLFFRYGSHEHMQQDQQIYGVKIWKNGELIKDYVPVRQISTNKYGLYDLVNDEFKLNDDSNYNFSGVSKSTPEYIYDNATTLEATHINRIYHKGRIYWGNEPSGHNIDGTSLRPFEIYFDRSITGPGSTLFTGGYPISVTYDSGNYYVDTNLVPNSLVGCFADNSAVTSIIINRLDTSLVTSIENMFQQCTSLQRLDVSNLDTSNVTLMGNLFIGCSSLNSLDLSSWNVSKVVRIWGAFRAMTSLTSIDLSSWNTSSLEKTPHAFYGDSALTSVNLSGWDVTHVNELNYMFYNCSSLITLDLSGWDLSSSLTTNYMFTNCRNVQHVYITTQNTLNKLTNNLRSQGNNYIPSSATIHYDDGTTQCDYVWDGSGWVQSNS